MRQLMTWILNAIFCHPRGWQSDPEAEARQLIFSYTMGEKVDADEFFDACRLVGADPQDAFLAHNEALKNERAA